MLKCHRAQSSNILSSVYTLSSSLIITLVTNYVLMTPRFIAWALTSLMGQDTYLSSPLGCLIGITNFTSETELLVLYYYFLPQNIYFSFNPSHLRNGISIHPVAHTPSSYPLSLSHNPHSNSSANPSDYLQNLSNYIHYLNSYHPSPGHHHLFS